MPLLQRVEQVGEWELASMAALVWLAGESATPNEIVAHRKMVTDGGLE
jgi:hypothetical protein